MSNKKTLSELTGLEEFAELKRFQKLMGYHPKRVTTEEVKLFYAEFEKWLADRDAYPTKYTEETVPKKEETYRNLSIVPSELIKEGAKVTTWNGKRYLYKGNKWVRRCVHDIIVSKCDECHAQLKGEPKCSHGDYKNFCAPCNKDRNFVQHKPINSVPSMVLEFCCHGNLKEHSQECCKRVKCVATIFKCTRDGIPRFGNYCGYHRRDFHPEPIKPKETKWNCHVRTGTRESVVAKFILDEYWLVNKIIVNNKYGVTKLRPDILMKFDTFHVIIEVDEEQHKKYCRLQEKVRMKEIFDDAQVPLVFIRFNPDSYTFNGTHYPKGIMECEIECKSRLEQLKMFIWKWYKEPPTTSSVHYLFYDSL